MSDIKTSLMESKLLTVIVSNQDYNKKVVELVQTACNSKKICYVSLNKPYDTILSELKNQKIDTSKIIFIDAMTKGKKTSSDDVVFVSSPRALTELNISVVKVMELKKVESIIFDSLSTLLVYEKPATVIKFVHALMAKLRSLRVGAIFIVLKEDINPDLVKNLYMFADEVVDLSDGKN
jgi:KaiC/GvpD/RAD55 family RecA-like ATPase